MQGPQDSTADSRVIRPTPANADDALHESLLSWKTWAVILVPALFFGLMEAAQLRLGSAVLGRPMPIGMALFRVLPYWLVLACVVPLVILAARRFASARYLLRPNALTVAGSAFAFALLALVARVLVSPEALKRPPLQLFQTYFLLDVLTYSALVGTLYAFYFYRRAESRELAASQLQTSLAEARLKVLQAQLEPHFLFNTLNAISVLALEGNQKAVVDTVGRLSELLRVSLSDERSQEVSLARELELVEGYLEIQKVRFADRLAVSYDISPAVLDAAVPAMVLQPIVENAVIHGVASQHEAGSVTIRAWCDAALLRLEVRDTGPGFGTRMATLRADGIGLAGTRARLQQLYQEEHSIEFCDGSGGGACVTISLPLRLVPRPMPLPV